MRHQSGGKSWASQVSKNLDRSCSAPATVIAPVSVGVGLLLFALRLYLIGRAGEIDRIEAWSIIGGDLAWVGFSAVLLLAYGAGFSEAGRWLIAVTALIVLSLAVLQFKGLRGATRAPSPSRALGGG